VVKAGAEARGNSKREKLQLEKDIPVQVMTA